MEEQKPNKQNTWQIATLEDRVIQALDLNLKAGAPIYVGQKNIEHMNDEHPEHYAKYGDQLAEIISSPTYVSKNPTKGSIEYIKEYTDENNDHVLVAVRATGSGTLFARTLFVMTEEKVDKYRAKGALIKI